MCGIAGILTPNDRQDADRQLSTMLSLINHRGPDESGIFESPMISMGMRRLSIIDLEHGHQPFHS